MAQHHVEQTAWRMIRSLPDWKSLRYLELGCADGHMVEQLHCFGVKDVRGTTLRPRELDVSREREYPEHVSGLIDRAIDLNSPLPYPDASFDVVYSVQVIEHLERHSTFLAEAARVLTPGGHLVLITPNLNRLGSRMRFAMTGCHHTKRDLPSVDLPLESLADAHQRCVDFPTLHHTLWMCGMRIESLDRTKVKPLSRMAMVLWGPMWLLTHRVCMRQAEGEQNVKARKDLCRWLMSPSLLMSEQVCLSAVKTGEPLPPRAGVQLEMKHPEPALTGPTTEM